MSDDEKLISALRAENETLKKRVDVLREALLDAHTALSEAYGEMNRPVVTHE